MLECTILPELLIVGLVYEVMQECLSSAVPESLQSLVHVAILTVSAPYTTASTKGYFRYIRALVFPY